MRVQGLGFSVYRVGFRVSCLSDLGFRVNGGSLRGSKKAELLFGMVSN